VAVAILVVGSLLKPRKPAADTVAPLSQTETQRLLRLAQRQSLDTMTEHFAAVAAETAARVVPVDGGMASGTAWSPDLVVVPAVAGPAPETVDVTTPSGDRLIATHFVSGPQMPLAAYRAIGLPETLVRTGSEPDLESGEWVLAVWRRELEHAFAPGHYIEAALARCGEEVVEELHTSIALSSEMSGGVFVDLDGNLVAVVLPCADRLAALSPRSVARFVAEGRSPEARLLSLYGLRVAPLDEAIGEDLGLGAGVMVAEVWDAYPAGRAGLRPGDMLRALDGQPVAAPVDLQPLLTATLEEAHEIEVQRGRRRVTLEISRDGAPGAGAEDAPDVVIDSPAAGFRVAGVAPGTRADVAGIRAGDRVVGIGATAPRSAADVRRTLEGDAAALVEIRREGRRVALLLR